MKKIRLKTYLLFWFSVLALQENSHAQQFLNLNFEYASFVVPPAYWGDVIDPTNAFFKWTVQGYCLYNDLTLGTPAVDLIGPVFPNGPGLNALQGSYSVFIQNFHSTGPQASINQTATVPSWAQSVSFLTSPEYLTNGLVSVNGISVPLTQSAPNRMAGDITAFSGQVATITFSSVGFLFLDDVQFLSARFATPNPELTLRTAGTGSLTLSWPVSASMGDRDEYARNHWLPKPSDHSEARGNNVLSADFPINSNELRCTNSGLGE
jgi:hypothetical protein